MSLELNDALEQRLEVLATETNRSASELAQEGLERFLDYEEDVLSTIQRGREDFAAGRVVEHEHVVARIEALLAGT